MLSCRNTNTAALIPCVISALDWGGVEWWLARCFFHCGRHLYIPPLSAPCSPPAPRSHHPPPTPPLQLVSWARHTRLQSIVLLSCFITKSHLGWRLGGFWYYQVIWSYIISISLLSSHLRTFPSSFIISLIVSRSTRVYHNDAVVVDLWTTLNSSMYQNSFIAIFFTNF